MLTERFDEALAFASALHRTQLRKGSNIPYVSHLLAVCSIVISHGGDEDQAVAALLHDAAEDQGGEQTLNVIRQRFGENVALIVADCTDAWTEPKPPWRDRKEAYLAALPGKPSRSLLVSLADKVHNAQAIADDRRADGEDVWNRFTGGREGSLWYYRALSDFFSSAMPGVLSNQLRRHVQSMTE
ncbi:HD domain-containing protein [Hyphomonas sp.]|uniref:HD domain-containing protein n=1 Tax=Hyphomonas sp. TaxID=87 RepID=UPI0025C15803|nr:HD domain-containing protein [Hyphomonas sp.]